MDWLNYHHLHYFWVVAQEGSLAAAGERLHLAQPTLSSQIKKLEKTIGTVLFERRGRKLVLTEAGHTAFGYADEIFTLGKEMTDALRGAPSGGAIKLTVGVPDVLPKLVVFHLLEPALQMEEEVRLETYEGKLDDLLADLAVYRLDFIISETPLPASAMVKAFNHQLGKCPLACYGTAKLARRHGRDFPESLNGAPFLLPTQNTVLRRALDQWFDEHAIQPDIKHEFEDSALLKVFAQEGIGLFFSAVAIQDHICHQYHVKNLGEIDVLDSFYAISVERRLKHPAVVAICNAARNQLFGTRRA